MVQVLLGQGAEPQRTDSQGWQAIHFAAHAGYLDIVKLLVESGNPPTAESKDGKTALW